MRMRNLLTLLEDEAGLVEAMVQTLAAEAWTLNTAAKGWTIAHQIAHLQWTDKAVVAAIEEPAEFAALRAEVQADPRRIDLAAEHGSELAPSILFTRWRQGRADLTRALACQPDDTKIDWFGPPMSATSMATARLMETWAHGQDIADALGVAHDSADDVLRNVAHLGVRTRDFSFHNRGLTPPAVAMQVDLTGPHGQTWRWGEDSAADVVTGPALDFCLLVTQRRHPDDLHLVVRGDAARAWVSIAQAFAGKATTPARRWTH